jgi:hypothetical protein
VRPDFGAVDDAVTTAANIPIAMTVVRIFMAFLWLLATGYWLLL